MRPGIALLLLLLLLMMMLLLLVAFLQACMHGRMGAWAHGTQSAILQSASDSRARIGNVAFQKSQLISLALATMNGELQ